MKARIFLLLLVVAIGTVIFLTRFGNSEQKAEKYYQSALELIEQGDEERAMVQLRNVFDLNGRHHDARIAYAELLRKRGDIAESYGHYLRLIEQYPDDVEGRRALAEMAIRGGNWEEAERHARKLLELAPDDLEARAMNAVLDYRDAVRRNDAAAKAKAVKAAKAVLAQDPEITMARRVLIQDALSGPRPMDALKQLDIALEQEPDSLELHQARLRLLALAGRDDEVGERLREMTRIFPDNERVQSSLIAWYLRRGDVEGAEKFMRRMAAEADAADRPGLNLAIVQFLRRTKGYDAARKELDNLIARSDDNADLYKAMRAVLDFELGDDREKAVADLENILDGAKSDAKMRDVRVILARMLQSSGNEVGARAEVEKVLSEDPGHVGALKMKAAWQIEDDKPEEAILTLRKALDQAPRDPELLTLMARAHERNGDHQLAGERLALAVEASGSAPAESLRYARFLIGEGRLAPAESVLIDALRRNPADQQLLRTLADIYIRQKDWPRARGIVRRLNEIGSEEAKAAANSIQTRLLLAQGKPEDSIEFVQKLIDAGDADARAGALVVQTHLREGNVEAAAAYADRLLEKAPKDPALRMLRAGVYMAEGRPDEAEKIYRALIAENPKDDLPVQALYTLLHKAGRDEEARVVLDQGLENAPLSPTLNWIRAGLLEKAGDIEGAIAIYEKLYERNRDDLVVANNLASLIAASRDDRESLERAFAIARRLRGSKVPAFQDTYGWLQLRRGNAKAALPVLEAAARGLPENPEVQLHLGLAYAALKDTARARETLERGLEMAKGLDLPVVEEARKALESLPAGE